MPSRIRILYRDPITGAYLKGRNAVDAIFRKAQASCYPPQYWPKLREEALKKPLLQALGFLITRLELGGRLEAWRERRSRRKTHYKRFLVQVFGRLKVRRKAQRKPKNLKVAIRPAEPGLGVDGRPVEAVAAYLALIDRYENNPFRAVGAVRVVKLAPKQIRVGIFGKN